MATKSTSESMRFLEDLCGGPLTMASYLWSIRKCDEVSQAAFAKKLGISRSHLCDIEKGRKLVSPGRAARFARTLGYLEAHFVTVALQDLVREAGLKFAVRVEAA